MQVKCLVYVCDGERASCSLPRKAQRNCAMAKDKQARDFLERDENSEIDELAHRIFSAALPPGWIDNTLYKDYAKDHHIEITLPITWGEPGKERQTKKVTGQTIYVQRKGVDGADFRHGNTVVAYEGLELRHLKYWADEAPLPIFLVVVDIKASKVYWLFMQEYLVRNREWRQQTTATIHIPVENELSDFKKFEEAIDRALKHMKFLRGGTVRETLDFYVGRLQQKDTRFQIEPRLTGQSEEYLFILKEPVSFSVQLRGDGPSSALKLVNLLDKGLPVTFAPGEATFLGTPIFDEFAENGAIFRFANDFEGTVTLTCLDSENREVPGWADLPGLYEGGRKEHRFQSSPKNCPFTVQFGPIGPNLGGAIHFSADPAVWINQRLRTASYFEKTYALFKNLLDHSRIRVEGQKDGNRFFNVTAEMTDMEVFRPFVRFLEIMQKARRVAEYFKIDPICTSENMNGENPLGDIEITHDVLFEGGYHYKYTNVSVNVTFLKSQAARITEEERELHDLILFTGQDYGYKFMDIPIRMGELAICLTDAKLTLTDAELNERIRVATDVVELTYSCSDTTKYTIRKATPEEIAAQPPRLLS